MQYRLLGQTGIKVSEICLGTMTWGEQNTEAEAHQQLDFALERGINFIDTAELYAIPPRAETQGLTETYIGSWLKKRQDRDKLIIASKVAGEHWPKHIRGGPKLIREQIRLACEQSLKRLQTDYIDLYQVHWPARSTNFFGQLGYQHNTQEKSTPITATIEALHELVEEGKIRHIGLSNETPWGVLEYLRLSEREDWPRIASIQNPYNLLNRSFEIGLAEIACREQVGLLAYSPLGFGTLSGKYLNGAAPAGARLTRWASQYGRYLKPAGVRATEAYVALAQAQGLSPAQMALAYVTSRPFTTSNIIGATNLHQLEQNIASADLQLSSEIMQAIEEIHTSHPNPCP